MKNTQYVFFSGGYDSTYFILYCLIVKQIKVQPVVVKVPFIDGASFKRYSLFHEEVSRQNFYKKFRKKYPSLSDNLLCEIVYENETVLDKETLEIGQHAYKSKILLGRPITMHLYLHQVSKDKRLNNIAALATKEDNLTDAEKEFVRTKLDFTTPLMEVSKYDMLAKAKEYGFSEFLYETWSCYHPNHNFKPCGKCGLCRDRIIETRLKPPVYTSLI